MDEDDKNIMDIIIEQQNSSGLKQRQQLSPECWRLQFKSTQRATKREKIPRKSKRSLRALEPRPAFGNMPPRVCFDIAEKVNIALIFPSGPICQRADFSRTTTDSRTSHACRKKERNSFYSLKFS